MKEKIDRLNIHDATIDEMLAEIEDKINELIDRVNDK